MNEEIILKMVNPYLENGTLTYDKFENIFCVLSLKEQYKVAEVLFCNGIELVDEEIEEVVLEVEVDEEDEFEILYDESIFKDQGIAEEHLFVNHDIHQSNEILCKLIQQGNRQAVQDLCVKNKRLVDKYVIGYQKKYGNRLDFEDLEQVGFLGLIKAAHRFDVERGGAFSTYAVFWIKQCISREIMDNGYAIRIPVHMMERISRVTYYDGIFSDENMGLQERINAIAEELAITCEDVRECMMLKKNYLSYASLNATVGEDEESELGEFILKEGEPSLEEMIEERFLHAELERVICTLSDREQKVLRLRFGMDDGKPRTLEEIGQMMKVTRERIRQIEAKALRKLRHPSRSKSIKEFL